MNIKNIQNIAKIYGEQSKVTKNCKNPGTSPAQRPDEVILSTHAQGLNQILRTAKGLPEVREDKVNMLSEQIAKGEYKVDARELADRIIAYSKNERQY
ncbi:flagellar biosynthesis anti-sigma factor FlgM [Sporomusa termitida]|uniref:Negative regulator of flagellin synthesis n=1 Tax=Sporomusa termitida TaxID=2377 RepID=A0A517DX89_9FIRM|nr:flagellar biosynthesis anti-sigma factor FlgM [Sporomusa termitida]QDR81970.1 flagellar biosynthesis anti-sigma factor FlgM [Sporomusa termitida]